MLTRQSILGSDGMTLNSLLLFLLKTNWRLLVLLLETAWRPLEDHLKTTWRLLEDPLKTACLNIWFIWWKLSPFSTKKMMRKKMRAGHRKQKQQERNLYSAKSKMYSWSYDTWLFTDNAHWSLNTEPHWWRVYACPRSWCLSVCRSRQWCHTPG